MKPSLADFPKVKGRENVLDMLLQYHRETKAWRKDFEAALLADVEKEEQEYKEMNPEDDLSEFLYFEDDRGDIFEAGRLLGRLQKARELLGESEHEEAGSDGV